MVFSSGDWFYYHVFFCYVANDEIGLKNFFYSLQYVPQGRIVQLATIKEIIFSWLCGLEGSTSLCFTKSFPTGLEATTHLGLHFKDEKFKVSLFHQ